jgi:hypothetical protein
VAGQKESEPLSHTMLQVDAHEFVRLVALSAPAQPDEYSDVLARESADAIVRLVPIAEAHGETADAGAIFLEEIRSAFTREREAALDWPAIFEELWAPVRRALDGTSSSHEVAVLVAAPPAKAAIERENRTTKVAMTA